MSIFSSPVVLSLMTAMLYGVGAPMMKITGQSGVSSSAATFSYGVALITLAFLWPSNSIVFASSKALALGALTGIILAFGFAFALHALAQPTGYVTLVVALVAFYPLVSVGIEMGFMDVQVQSKLGMVSGVILIVAGGFIVAISSGEGVQ
ncbi:hypothetical protein MNBD_BACTEROID05-44 [hydrothermal vent metagenome]|uniref:EamA domain-containing protein n=1 Tax=hydrothermal vent metagenome TaxID=652676 RepID=A0A3B0TT34_9ZZZZ